VAYVIASSSRFSDGRVLRLENALGYRFVRVDPVFSNVTDCSWNETNTASDQSVVGIFLAHRNAWASIALNPFAQRALVLESDFAVGNRTDEELTEKLNAAWAREQEDITSVGWCDACPNNTSPCWSCATAYIMHPRLADRLISTDFCMPAESALVGVCPDHDGSDKGLWAADFREHVGLVGPANCSFLHEPSMFSDQESLSWRGIFQQDREHTNSTEGPEAR
jgi:hypothetical protein